MRQKSRRETGSTPLVGSSRKSTRGVWMSAQASPSFCFMPPERLPARRRWKGAEVAEAEKPRRCFAVRSAPGHAVEVGVEVRCSR